MYSPSLVSDYIGQCSKGEQKQLLAVGDHNQTSMGNEEHKSLLHPALIMKGWANPLQRLIVLVGSSLYAHDSSSLTTKIYRLRYFGNDM
jgi:hypothetical protein